MKLILTTLMTVFMGSIAHAEPFLGCLMGIKDSGRSHAQMTWVESEMERGSSIPVAAGNPNAMAQGLTEKIVPFTMADGRTVELYTRWKVEFAKKFDHVGSPFFHFELDFQIREQGEQEFQALFSDKRIMSHYVPGFMVLNPDLSLRRMEISNGIPTEKERANDLTITFFCDPITIQHVR